MANRCVLARNTPKFGVMGRNVAKYMASIIDICGVTHVDGKKHVLRFQTDKRSFLYFHFFDRCHKYQDNEQLKYSRSMIIYLFIYPRLQVKYYVYTCPCKIPFFVYVTLSVALKISAFLQPLLIVTDNEKPWHLSPFILYPHSLFHNSVFICSKQRQKTTKKYSAIFLSKKFKII